MSASTKSNLMIFAMESQCRIITAGIIGSGKKKDCKSFRYQKAMLKSKQSMIHC